MLVVVLNYYQGSTQSRRLDILVLQSWPQNATNKAMAHALAVTMGGVITEQR